MQKPVFIVIHKKTLIYVAIVCLMVIILPTFVIGVMNEQINTPISNLLQGRTIVIDPGHGGVDGGTHFANKLLEKNINLEIAMKLKKSLRSNGANVIMTREKDISLDDGKDNGSRHREDLNARVHIINSNMADTFVSIHVNSIKGNPSKSGPIVFYYNTSERGKILGEYIQECLNRGLTEYTKQGIKLTTMSAKGDYYILRNTEAPGVIVETGFITSELDRRLLQSDKHQQEVVDAITAGVIMYFQNDANKENNSF